METQHGAWLRELAAAQKGGVVLSSNPITRGLPYMLLLSLPIDATPDTFSASLRMAPDAPGEPLADFAVDISAFDGTATTVAFLLTVEQVNALPADGDADGLAEAVFDIIHAPLGSLQYRLLGGVIPILGKVTDAS